MKTLLTFLACFFLLTIPSAATKYFVSPSGSNSFSGLSSSTPFLTIEKGISTASSYDSVIVLSGTYPILNTLTISKPITLLGMGASIDGGSWSVSYTHLDVYKRQPTVYSSLCPIESGPCQVFD